MFELAYSQGMGLWGLLLLSVGLSMDSLVAAVSPALRLKSWFVPFIFAFFQAGFLLVGIGVGYGMSKWVQQYDHWIAFLILIALGGMAWKKSAEEPETSAPTRFSRRPLAWVFASAVGTSVDALGAGTSLTLSESSRWEAIGIVFVVTALVVAVGQAFSRRVQAWRGFHRLPLWGAGIFFALALKTLWAHRDHLI